MEVHVESVKFLKNIRLKKNGEGARLDDFSESEANNVLNFHESFKEYAVTPLVELNSLASYYGVGGIYVKDESKRFGLNAFKVLGGSYAMGRLLAEKLEVSADKVTSEKLRSDETRKKLGEITFATATDGNHGRGVAWTAQQLGQKAEVYMPKGAAKERVDNITATGATCTVTDLNYDDAVRLANSTAEKNGWIMVQDTAWEGYEDIPRWIMQGYMTLIIEAVSQLRDKGIDRPTHVFLQAGVGSFAGAVLGFLAKTYPDNLPVVTIVEPDKADCIYQSMLTSDGSVQAVKGDLDTLMAGLACGEPSTISWGVLRDYAAASISCPDYIAANGMRILSSPSEGDERIISGESGAATCGIVDYIMANPNGETIKKELGLDENSEILLISTEGDTSPEIYRDVVWYGRNTHKK
ncbi:hypothetical protein AAG570_014020 [Ranatra chinensis]|uniref:Tryptophan synthase beta chain-like PALP domain-containing protein n=1 Tax=Ranatra chinensis TaxID=642074 RepID=A0ABD0YAS6_9HEMI